jgi:Fe-S-cluster containining protein
MDVDAIMLLPSDYEKLKRMDEKVEDKTEKVADIFYLMPNEQNICPYFDMQSKQCSIHKFRPKVCRAYPFSYRTPSVDSSFTAVDSVQINPQSLYLTLCERFWTINQEDYKEGVKAIFQLRREKFNLGILSDNDKPTKKEREIRAFEQSLEGETTQKKFPFDLYLMMVEQNKVLFLMFLKLFDAYFDDPEEQKEEYEDFIENYIAKFQENPKILKNAFKELKTRWKKNKKSSFEFSFTFY